MLHHMTRRRTAGTRGGFTLLEVLLATAIMAVGTTSVLVVIATAAGMASQRQVLQRREQVIDEARHDAQAIVNSFRPGTPEAGVAKIGTGKGTTKQQPAFKTAPDTVTDRGSTRFGGFSYDLAFQSRDRTVPEKGYDVGITIHYGGGELSYATSTTVIATAILEDEFKSSATWLDEQKGLQGGNKPKETK